MSKPKRNKEDINCKITGDTTKIHDVLLFFVFICDSFSQNLPFLSFAEEWWTIYAVPKSK